MIRTISASKYAKAFFALASSAAEAERHLKQLEEVNAFLNKAKLWSFFAAPQITQNQKEKLLEKICIDPIIRNFLALLFKKNRFKYLPEIVLKYQTLLMKKKEVLPAKLISSHALDQETIEQLQVKLNHLYQKKTEIVNEVDPKLIGGGVLIINDQIIDFSIKNKLNSLKRDLTRG